MKTLCDVLRQSAERNPDAPAVGWTRAAGGGGFTYRELHGAMRTGAEALRRADLRPGDKVLLHLDARPEWAAALFAILEAGAVPIPAETPPEIVARAAAFADARAAILGERTQRAADGLRAIRCIDVERLVRPTEPENGIGECPSTSPTTTDPGQSGTGDLRARDDDNALAILAFTSGSTDQPRAVELTHANILADLRGLLALREARPGDAFLSMLPPAHLFETTAGLLGPIACGARVVYPGSILPNRLADALREEHITHALCVPALLDALHAEVVDGLVESGHADAARRGQSTAETARRIREELTREDLGKLRDAVRARVGESLHTLIVGGAAIDPAWTEIALALEVRLEVGYGLTEAGPVVSMGLAAECPPGSVGRPLPGISVRVDAHREIQVRGANVARGYHRDPAATAAAFDDGWLRTGDRGHLDADGFLFVTGRIKEAMVAANGETVYPEEAEAYYGSPLFSEFCVAGLRGPNGNDVPALFAVPASPDVRQEALREAYENLRALAPPRFRVQRFVRLDHPLPRTPTGKVRRRTLAAACGAKLQVSET